MPETNNKENVVKKTSFFRNVLKSIKSFEKYEDFGIEGFGRTASYFIKIVAIFTLVVVIMAVYKFSNSLNNALAYFNENVTELKYEDGTLNVNSNTELEISSQNNIAGKIIINTSDLNEEQINQYRENIKNESNGIVLLKDKIILKNEMLSATSETTYSELFTQYKITSLDKQMILDYFNNNIIQIYFVMFLIMYIYLFAIYMASFLVDSLVLAALGYLTARLTGMKIRFGAAFSMGVHALTLPIILNMIYVIFNGFTGYTIKYFQFMYTAISYIYIITAVLIIRSDYIKRQIEVEKIKDEQERIREELREKQQKEDDEKEQEKEKQKQKDKEKKEQEGEEKVPDIGDKPEGSNV